MLSLPIWKHIANKTTENMKLKVVSGEVTGKYVEKYYKTNVSVEELLFIIGLLYVFRGRKNNTSLDKQFKEKSPYYEIWPISKKR